MALETATYIDGLVASNPASTDGLGQADDHLRLIKGTLKATLPNLSGPVTATQGELNVLDGYTGNTSDLNLLSGAAAAGVTGTEFQYLSSVTSDIQAQLDAKAPLSSPTFTGTATIPTASVTNVNLGSWTIYVSGTDLKFKYNGTDVFKLTTTGALTVEGDVTASGSA